MFFLKNMSLDFEKFIKQYTSMGHAAFIANECTFLDPEIGFKGKQLLISELNHVFTKDFIKKAHEHCNSEYKLDDLLAISPCYMIPLMLDKISNQNSINNGFKQHFAEKMIDIVNISECMQFGSVYKIDKSFDLLSVSETLEYESNLTIRDINPIEGPLYFDMYKTDLHIGEITEIIPKSAEEAGKCVNTIYVNISVNNMTAYYTAISMPVFVKSDNLITPSRIANRKIKLNPDIPIMDALNGLEYEFDSSVMMIVLSMMYYINISGDANRSMLPAKWSNLKRKYDRSNFEPKKNEIKKSMDAIERHYPIIIGANYESHGHLFADDENSKRKKCEFQIPVRGHFRNARVGIGRNETRLVWIKEQLRNPEGKPRDTGKRYKIV